MINYMSAKLAAGIKAKAPDHPASEAVLKYTISFLLNSVFVIGLTLAISAITGRFVQAATVLVSFAILRQISGGLHLKSGMLCVLVSTACATALSFSSFGRTWTIVLTAAAAVLAAVYAPSRIEKQTRIHPRFFPYLRMLSVLLIVSNLLWLSPVLAATFAVQAATLIRLINRKEGTA